MQKIKFKEIIGDYYSLVKIKFISIFFIISIISITHIIAINYFSNFNNLGIYINQVLSVFFFIIGSILLTNNFTGKKIHINLKILFSTFIIFILFNIILLMVSFITLIDFQFKNLLILFLNGFIYLYFSVLIYKFVVNNGILLFKNALKTIQENIKFIGNLVVFVILFFILLFILFALVLNQINGPGISNAKYIPAIMLLCNLCCFPFIILYLEKIKKASSIIMLEN